MMETITTEAELFAHVARIPEQTQEQKQAIVDTLMEQAKRFVAEGVKEPLFNPPMHRVPRRKLRKKLRALYKSFAKPLVRKCYP
jgi:hypothetical protein